MLENMSTSQLWDWMAYQQLYGPINPLVRGDIQAALVARTDAQINAKKGKKLKIKSFLPFPIDPPKRDQTIAEMKSIMNTLAGQRNG